jgi:hypothetical protein
MCFGRVISPDAASSGLMKLCLAGVLGLLLLAAPDARAQSVGFSVNGGCDVGACPPTTPLPIGGSEFQPFSFTVSTVDGDSYQFDGEIGELSENGGSYLPGSRAYTITYLGNSAGGTSRGTTFTTHVFFDFTPLPNGDYALIADAGGAFFAGIGDGTSVTVSWSFDDGAVKSSTFGPFSPPNSFFQSETDTVIPPPGGPLTADVLTTIAFGAGSPVGSVIIIGSVASNVLAAAVLPGGRSVQIGSDATVFATILNSANIGLNDCQVALPPSAPAGLQLTYQTTDPATNALTGSPNTPVAIGANGSQTFLLDFKSSEAVNVTALPLYFDCDSTLPATSIAGVNTVDLVFSTTPIADIVALAATATNDGTVHVAGGAGAFAVATVDVGAAATLTASTDTGAATLPASITLCQTAASGQCLSPPAAAVPISFTANATPTFSIFVSSSSTIPFAPGSSRVFVRFEDAGGVSHGSTSVAVTTE